MSGITAYFLRVIAAALICSIFLSLAKTASAKRILRISCGAFLMVVALSPLLSLRLGELGDYLQALQTEAEQQAAVARDDVTRRLQAIIKENTEAYILDKAEQIGAAITVDVQLAADKDYPYPTAATLSGVYTQAQKETLQEILEVELNIPRAQQNWRHG